MEIYRRNEKLDGSYEDGIWLDYQKHTFLFFVKDREWMKDELKSAWHRDVTVSFVQEGIVDLFLLEMEDCLECSDIPFCIKDAPAELLQSLDDHEDYAWEAVLLQEDNTAVCVRDGIFEHGHSEMLRECLKKHQAMSFTSDDFDQAYAKLSREKEPYEMEPQAVFTERSRKK